MITAFVTASKPIHAKKARWAFGILMPAANAFEQTVTASSDTEEVFRAAVTGLWQALEALNFPEEDIRIVSDSKELIDAVKKALPLWRTRQLPMHYNNIWLHESLWRQVDEVMPGSVKFNNVLEVIEFIPLAPKLIEQLHLSMSPELVKSSDISNRLIDDAIAAKPKDTWDPFAPPKVLKPVAKNAPNMVLDPTQSLILKRIEKGSNILIQGPAGTGKSLIIRRLETLYKDGVVLMAPTALAAVNVGGATIHSTLKIGIGFAMANDKRPPNSKIAELIRKAKIFVFDEISMVRADLLDRIDWMFQQAMSNKLPFGGKQIVLFGDSMQLPPVVNQNEAPLFDENTGIYNSPWFFSANSFKDNFQCYALTKIFRQTDPLFKELLNQLRMGDHRALAQINSVCVRKEYPRDALRMVGTNAKAEEYNQRMLREIDSPLMTSDAEYVIETTDPMQQRNLQTAISDGSVEKQFSWPAKVLYKVGARIQMLENDYDAGYRNGQLGSIVRIVTDKQGQVDRIEVKLDSTQAVVPVKKSESVIYQYTINTKREVEKEPYLKVIQFPFRLGWALTVHKLQGQTLENVVIDNTASNMFFERGQLYVALSRATSLSGLHLLRPLTQNNLIVCEHAKRFVKRVEGAAVQEEAAL